MLLKILFAMNSLFASEPQYCVLYHPKECIPKQKRNEVVVNCERELRDLELEVSLSDLWKGISIPPKVLLKPHDKPYFLWKCYE